MQTAEVNETERLAPWAPWEDPALRRQALLVLGLIALSLALRVLTWDVVADGGRARYVKTALLGGAAAWIVWLLVLVQTHRRSWLPLICAAVLLLVGDAIHYVRLANPITRGAPILSFSGGFSDEAQLRQRWDVETAAGGRSRLEGSALVLESPAGGPAYAQARLGTLGDVGASWWLPLGIAERDRVEQLSWRARITRTGPFYVVTEIRDQLLVQAVSYGVHITYPDERRVARGHEVQHPAGSDGQTHDWQITRDAREIALKIDGRTVWTAPQRGELNQLKLGETKTDPAHAGSMRIESASYTAALDRR